MIPLEDLPALNATLNATSAVLLAGGWLAIRRRAVHVHRACMVAAFVTSVVFLASYLTYHLQVGTTRFAAQGWIRPVYFSLLGTHTVLAALIPPLAIVTLSRAARGRFAAHARLARWTLPTWFYVSVTGVVIYLLLYHLPGARYPVARRASDVVAAKVASAKAASTTSDVQSPGSPVTASGPFR
jgi:putative membrane protein